VPTYQYVCTECATPLEAVQKFTDDALTQCPTCGGKLRKLFSSVGIVFKGSGFYRTDSRSEAKVSADAGGSASASSDSGSTGASAGSSSESGGSGPKPAGEGKSGTDAKPAAKSDAGASNGVKSNGAKSDSGKSDSGKSGTKPTTSGGGSKTAATT
jgi:putative FmdB family regulatory protein